ncbi:hypothetical protein A3844_07540 [Paenibacillus helianthi]|uniref:Uncharacterized protein n=1 Tax=Paenibacillus helianthi TaxID=1349432 RepID=A0ABX3EVF2_9BACL|nr:hypothetical protein [Paenibacillus helianthi]OKP88542.1 hypothetical protein A3844_07540 [Paenibacillus helianthi]
MRQFGLTSDLPPQFGGWMTALVWMLTLITASTVKGGIALPERQLFCRVHLTVACALPLSLLSGRAWCCLHHFRQSCR